MKIRVFEAFAGYGSQSLALERLKRHFPEFDYEVVGISEIDRYAVTAYKALHGDVPNYGDISKIDWNKVPDFNLFTYSFPCGLSGTKVKTEIGYKNIEDVVCGDKVLTYKNRYCEVVRTMSRMCPTYYKINAIGCKLKLTEEHPLWVLRDGVEQWIKVKDLTKNDKLSYCIPQGNEFLNISDKKLWLLGRYVADGFINKHLYNSVLFAIGNKKEAEFLSNVPCELKDKFRKFQKSCIEYRIADKELQDLCMEFGVGAVNKHIPEWLFSANKNQIEHFLNGYFSGDGHVRYRSGSKVKMFTTVSKDLFLGIQMLILKCYGKVCSLSIRNDKRKPTFNDTYNGQISFSESPYQKVIGDRIFVSIKSIDKIEKEVQVYNLEVSEDNSYTCDNVNTHNCTDISSAGQQKGLEEGSGTASSLLWECRKAIVAKRPRYLLMENVKALVSLKFLPYFLKWQSELVSYGYSNFARVLNAKDFGVPQNRERIFMVSILDRQATYHFPEPFPLDRRIKDILEEDVDDRYFLSEKLVDYVFSNGGKAGDIKGATGVHEPDDDIAGTVTAQYWKTPRQGNYIKYPCAIGYTRDGKGKVVSRHLQDISNTVKTNTGGGGNTDCFILTPRRNEYGKSVRKEYESGQLDESRHKMTDLEPRTDGISNTVTTVQKDNLLLIEPKVIQVGNIVHAGNFNNPQRGRVYSPMGISPTINTMAGGNLEPKIVIGSAQKNAYVGSVDGPSPCINAACGMGGGQTPMIVQMARGFNKGELHEISPTISANSWECNNFLKEDDFKIRKLTPRECLRLMDVDDADIDKMFCAGLSNTQLYKMAGNSIVVNVLYHIFRKMFVEKENENEQLTIF